MKKILLFTAISGMVIVGVCLLVSRGSTSVAVGVSETKSNDGHSPIKQSKASPSERTRRAAEMKAKLAVAAASSRQEPVEEKTGWEEVPSQLDELLSKELIDVAAGKQYFQDAERFIAEYKLEGTTVLNATCGKSMCKILYRHETKDSFRSYQEHMAFSPWKDSSNYFKREDVESGAVESSIWLGRDDFTLPLDEMRRRNATGQYAEEQ